MIELPALGVQRPDQIGFFIEGGELHSRHRQHVLHRPGLLLGKHQRGVGRSQVAVHHVLVVRPQENETGHARRGLLQPGHHRAIGGVFRRLRQPAAVGGQPVVGILAVIGPPVARRTRTDDRVLVGQLRQVREQLTDLDARYVGVDRLERAAKLNWGVRLGIERVPVRRPTRQPDTNHLFRPGGDALARTLSAEEIGQSQAKQRRTADTEKVAAIERVNHGLSPSRSVAVMGRRAHLNG